MSTGVQPAPVSKLALWAGRILSALVVLLMLGSGASKFNMSPDNAEKFKKEFGYNPDVAPILGAVEITCAVIYAIPYTAGLGAILLTGYLGGAVATHVRVDDPMFVGPVIVGVVVWLGLYLRDRRVRAVAPLRV